MMITETVSPIGRIRLAIDRGRLCGLEFVDRWRRVRGSVKRRDHGRTDEDASDLLRRLEAYFAGDVGALAGLPVETGGTPFQRLVWAEMLKIPVGKTLSYGELARRIGFPGAARAVGAASGSNPVGIVIPCHRVVGAGGKLTGYGGGLARKRWLLRHEGVAA